MIEKRREKGGSWEKSHQKRQCLPETGRMTRRREQTGESPVIEYSADALPYTQVRDMTHKYADDRKTERP